ncbi:MAG TPA: COX15/CtaA family protein, partial [Bryobacteraceae bacterium]|nr:COX15/CtaA family protein [Bryobacteraceae bacterium]
MRALSLPSKPAAEPASSASGAFQRYAWAVVACNVLVVLWGAYVRATGSGAGCGSHWPLCNGAVLPREPAAATIIEFTHRTTSGIALLSVAALVVWAFRVYPATHRVRRAALFALVFIVIEALLGAGLVLFRLVAENSSPARAAYLSAHLANTLVLLGLLAAT